MFVENKGLNPNSATKGKEDQINDLPHRPILQSKMTLLLL